MRFIKQRSVKTFPPAGSGGEALRRRVQLENRQRGRFCSLVSTLAIHLLRKVTVGSGFTVQRCPPLQRGEIPPAAFFATQVVRKPARACHLPGGGYTVPGRPDRETASPGAAVGLKYLSLEGQARCKLR